MKKLLILIILLLVGCTNYDKNVQNGVKCKYSGGQYLTYEPGDGWLAIMLPGTKFALSISEWDKEKEEWVYVGNNEGKKGHPTRLDEFDDDYIANVKVVMWHEVSDGNYCVFRRYSEDEDPMWTVWSKELMQAVKEKQGL